jgi:hypothetical protein
MIAAPDQTLQTKVLQTKVLQAETYIKCRIWKHFDETVEHISSSRLVLATEQYVKRYGTLCAELHVYTCKELGMKLENDH